MLARPGALVHPCSPRQQRSTVHVQSNPGIRAWMAAQDMDQPADLEQHYLTRLLDLTAQAGSPASFVSVFR